jgi:hydrophobe/amphiphile efflux-1 (HAE1) family protein
MSISEPFIRRPIATILLMAALFVGGITGYLLLPVSAMPNVAFPTISVSASLPGASPDVMAASVAQPLERQFAMIPGVTQIVSTNIEGNTNITVQFALSRNLDGAASDIQAAINAASGSLPKNLPSPPSYRKVNPADTPVLLLGLTSKVMPLYEVNHYADTGIAQQLSTLPGVGQVLIFGQQQFAPTVQLNPSALAARGIGLNQVATAISNATAEQPLGSLQGPQQAYQIGANGQIFSARKLGNVIVAYKDGAPVRIKDLGRVIIGSDTPFVASWVNDRLGEIVAIWKQPDANTLQLVDAVKSELPRLEAAIPRAIHVSVIADRSLSIRASVSDVEFALGLTIVLVVLVTFVFLRTFWATVIPSITMPLSLVGTFGVMYLLGYSLDNISLMALTLAVALVVDDAVVMLENVFRYLETGDDPLSAALKGAGEIGFTIVSITISLIAVFIPVLFMGGIIGRMFREFGVTVAIAIVLSAILALTLSPTMAALVLENPHAMRHGRLYRANERAFAWLRNGYARLLRVVLRWRLWAFLFNLALIALSLWLVVAIPKGFLPQEDTGLIFAFTKADPDVSFAQMAALQKQATAVVLANPNVASVGSAIGGGASTGDNTGRMFINLKPWNERKATAQQVIAQLYPKLSRVPGIETFMQVLQDVRVGARLAPTQYQYTLQDMNSAQLYRWAPKVLARMKTIPGLTEVTSDQQTDAPQVELDINRNLAARLGVNVSTIEQTLGEAFGQSYVAQLYGTTNTYHVIMELAPQYQDNPSALSRLYVSGSGGQLVPLSQFVRMVPRLTNLAVNEQGEFPAVTISFNLKPGTALGQAVNRIQAAEQQMHAPPTLIGSFQGTAQAFQASLKTEPLLIAAAIFAVYVVLGVLYESFIHPITILLSLPAAAVGALAALDLFGFELTLIAIIGLLMLIGIVKKNAIMMIDFALERRRHQHLSAEQAIYEAAVLRFRPIMMTTMAAIFGILPIAIGFGAGAALRQPLGVAVVGGLVVSQILTLFTIPVTYIYMDRLSDWLARLGRRRRRGAPPQGPDIAPDHAPVPAGHHGPLAIPERHAAE